MWSADRSSSQMITALSFLIAVLALQQASTVEAIPDSVRLFGNLEPYIEAKPISRWESTWPHSGPTIRVPASKIPQNLKADAESWIKRVLKDEFLPSSLQSRMVGFRGYAPDDLIGIRYQTKQNLRIQIIEDGGCVTVTFAKLNWDGNPEFAEEFASRAMEVAKLVLNISSQKLRIGKVVGGLRKEDLPRPLFQGSLEIESEGKGVWHLAWWNRIFVLSAGDVTSFTIRKSLGTGEPGTNAQGGLKGGRFGNIGG